MAANFFGRISGWDLLNLAHKLQRMRCDLFRSQGRRGIRPQRFAIGVVSVRFESKTHGAAVPFAAAGVETREPRSTAERQNQYSGRQRVERPEVADAAKTNNAAHGFNHIVR